MLVFRNSSSYERYWGGRTELQRIVTSLRNLTRSILVNGPTEGKEQTIRVLIATTYAVKNYLRGIWGLAIQFEPEYAGLLPPGVTGHESHGVGLPVELLYHVESYIKRGAAGGFFNAPQSSMLSGQVCAVMDAFGKMETIKLTPIPVCHQIHQKQVLALYCAVLPFCLVDEMGWWAVPVITLVCFTLYGIEGIGEELEDPFGVDKNDIRIDAVIEDAKQEVSAGRMRGEGCANSWGRFWCCWIYGGRGSPSGRGMRMGVRLRTERVWELVSEWLYMSAHTAAL